MPKCDDCAIKSIHNGGCPIFQADMSGKDGCPYFAGDLHLCEICGRPILGSAILDQDEGGGWHEICHNCMTANLCQICCNQYCAFEQDQSCQEPPYVMAQMRQGNAIMQTQVPNPKRVEATCRKGCPCFNEDGLDNGTYCIRRSGDGCRNHRVNWRR